MTKQERIDQERAFEQTERHIAATLKLAAAMERVAAAQEYVAQTTPTPVGMAAFVPAVPTA